MNKIPYELALELKSAGFPQAKGFGEWLTEDGHIYSGGAEPHAWAPFLSELIEACGDEVRSIFKADKAGKQIWVARCCDKHLHSGEGSTPEIAVARLWLALNPPHHDYSRRYTKRYKRQRLQPLLLSNGL